MFWMFMGFIKHFYIIFGTNLLTEGPSQNCYFFAYFNVSKRRNIKRSRNERNQLQKLFLEGKLPEKLGVHVRKETRDPRGRGAHPPP